MQNSGLTGTQNCFFGYRAGQGCTGSANVGVGFEVLQIAGGSLPAANTAVGYQCMANSTSGITNVAMGYQTLYGGPNTGNSNCAIGYGSMQNNTTGGTNSAIGALSMSGNTTGSDNSAVGQRSLLSNTTGSQNVAIGSLALGSNISGNLNVAVGFGSLNGYTGSQSIGIGYNALAVSSAGSNIGIGSQVLNHLSFGSNNIALGNNAATAYYFGESNNIIIGNNGVTGDNQVIRLGTTQTNCVFGSTGNCLLAANGIDRIGSVKIVPQVPLQLILVLVLSPQLSSLPVPYEWGCSYQRLRN